MFIKNNYKLISFLKLPFFIWKINIPVVLLKTLISFEIEIIGKRKAT